MAMIAIRGYLHAMKVVSIYLLLLSIIRSLLPFRRHMSNNLPQQSADNSVVQTKASMDSATSPDLNTTTTRVMITATQHYIQRRTPSLIPFNLYSFCGLHTNHQWVRTFSCFNYLVMSTFYVNDKSLNSSTNIFTE